MNSPATDPILVEALKSPDFKWDDYPLAHVSRPTDYYVGLANQELTRILTAIPPASPSFRKKTSAKLATLTNSVKRVAALGSGFPVMIGLVSVIALGLTLAFHHAKSSQDKYEAQVDAQLFMLEEYNKQAEYNQAMVRQKVLANKISDLSKNEEVLESAIAELDKISKSQEASQAMLPITRLKSKKG